jgi:hypothetical protein
MMDRNARVCLHTFILFLQKTIYFYEPYCIPLYLCTGIESCSKLAVCTALAFELEADHYTGIGGQPAYDCRQ